MPTYQYKCPHCGHAFEEFQSITEAPVSTCPECGKEPRRIITGGAGFLLKGSGFYTTDYRSPSYQAAAKKDKETPPPSPEKKSESTTSPSETKKSS